MIFARIADFVVKHHKAIVIFWVFAFAVALVANQFWKLDDITSYSVQGFLPKDTESAEADRIVADQFPAEGIIAAAKEHGCDLIVMASHGRRGIAGLLLGSETTKVLTHSKTPVLVCR